MSGGRPAEPRPRPRLVKYRYVQLSAETRDLLEKALVKRNYAYAPGLREYTAIQAVITAWDEAESTELLVETE